MWLLGFLVGWRIIDSNISNKNNDNKNNCNKISFFLTKYIGIAIIKPKLTFIQKFEQYWSKTLNTSTSISISKYIKSKAFNANAVRVVEIPFFITLLKQTWKRKRIEWLEHKEDSKFTLLYTINRPHIYLFTKVFLEMSDSAFQTFRKSYWCTQKTDFFRNILRIKAS